MVRKFICFSLPVYLLFCSCKKEITASELKAADIGKVITSSLAQSDGIVSIESGIMPPVTQQCFITPGRTSFAAFQIVASEPIVIEYAFFSGEYPLINYIYSENIGIGVNHESGGMSLLGVGEVNTNGRMLIAQVNYEAPDSSTSGSVVKLNLTGLLYRTNNEVYHTYYPAKPVSAQPMCVVNNVPHILFQDPKKDTIANGYKEIAQVKLTGDTTYTLNALPLDLWSPYQGSISKSKLVIKHKDETVATSKTIKLNGYSRTQTVINFPNGFVHKAGKQEVLKIYADVHTNRYTGKIITSMYPLHSFVWTDGLGTLIPGAKNDKFFKEQTGQANYQK